MKIFNSLYGFVNNKNTNCWCVIWTNDEIRTSRMWCGNEKKETVINSKTPGSFEVVGKVKRERDFYSGSVLLRSNSLRLLFMGLLRKCALQSIFPYFSLSFFSIFLPPFINPLSLLFIDEEGSYSSNETKRPIPRVTGLVHLIKLHLCWEQLLWTWQKGAVATVNSLLRAEKAGD